MRFIVGIKKMAPWLVRLQTILFLGQIIDYLWWSTTSAYEHNEQLHEKRFHDVALSITLGSTNGSECTTSSVDMLSPQHTTTTNGFAYNTLKPPKNLYFIICKKLCFLSELNSTPGVEAFKHWPLGHGASTYRRFWSREFYLMKILVWLHHLTRTMGSTFKGTHCATMHIFYKAFLH